MFIELQQAQHLRKLSKVMVSLKLLQPCWVQQYADVSWVSMLARYYLLVGTENIVKLYFVLKQVKN